jgi:hypothetical protein
VPLLLALSGAQSAHGPCGLPWLVIAVLLFKDITRQTARPLRARWHWLVRSAKARFVQLRDAGAADSK